MLLLEATKKWQIKILAKRNKIQLLDVISDSCSYSLEIITNYKTTVLK